MVPIGRPAHIISHIQRRFRGGHVLKYNAIERLAQKIASTRWGSLLFRYTQRHLDNAVLAVTGGCHTLASFFSSIPMVTVTSVGARSGQRRTHALLRVDDPGGNGRFAVVASNYAQSRLPGWYYNLKKNPQATCVIDGRTALYFAREATGEEWEQLWTAAVDVFPGFGGYAERLENVRRIPIIVFEKD